MKVIKTGFPSFVLIIIFILFDSLLSIESLENAKTVSSCGASVLNYLNSNYFNANLPETFFSENSLSFEELLSWCNKISPDSRAIKASINDLETLPMPAILHYSSDHYIALLGFDNHLYSVHDPAAPQLLKVSQNHLAQLWSGKAIIFEHNDLYDSLTRKELANTVGAYQHENTIADSKGDQLGDHPDNVNIGECSNTRGKPVLSINPVTLNVVAIDIPMWYHAGYGPDIELKLVYNGEDSQEITGGLPLPTQYFPFGKRWSFSYGAFYHENTPDSLTFILPDGKREHFYWDDGRFINIFKHVYDKLERYSLGNGFRYVLSMKDSKLKYLFDDPVHKKLTAIEDRNGNRVTFDYNSENNLSQITDASGRSTQIILNSQGRIIEAIDPLGRHSHFQYGYTDDEYLVNSTDMGGYQSTIDYDIVEVLQKSDPGPAYETRIVAIKTPTGTSIINYDVTDNNSPGNVGFILEITNPNGVISAWTYQSWNDYGIATFTDNNSNIYQYYINIAKAQISSIVYPDLAASVFYGYDTYGNRSMISKAGWRYPPTYFSHDNHGNVTYMTNPLRYTTEFTYDIEDNVKTITDPMGRVTAFDYDENSNLIQVTTPTGSNSYSYNANGNIESSRDPNGNVARYEYDTNGYLAAMHHPLGPPSTYINDAVGRTISVTANGLQTGYEYDDLNNITRIRYPDGSTANYNYNMFNLVSYTDRGGRNTQYNYDGMSQVISESGPNGFIIYNRDGNGNILDIIVNGQTTSYAYDNLDQVTTVINPDGTSRSYTYDSLGNLSRRIDENGRGTDYSYDYKLLLGMTYGSDYVAYSYNQNGEVRSMTDGIGTTTYTYDDGGRLLIKDGPFADDQITYRYDSAGNRLSMSLPDFSVNYTYDELHRLTSVISTHASTRYDYNLSFNYLTRVTYGNGTFTEYVYDSSHRLVSLQNKKSDGSIISGFNYTYDMASMITQIVDHEQNTHSYQYDYAYQLIDEDVTDNAGKTLWHNQFVYDPMGNRLSLNKNGIVDRYTYNINNQLTDLVQTEINVRGIIDGETINNVYVDDIKANIKHLGGNRTEFEAVNIPLDNGQDSIQVYSKVNEFMSTIDDSAKFLSTVSKIPDGSIIINHYTDTTGINPTHLNTFFIKRNNIEYIYDANGNLIQKKLGENITKYSYDAENRLIRIDLPDGNYQEYKYDGEGQRAKVLDNGILSKIYIYDSPFEAVMIIKQDGKDQYLTRGNSLGGGIGGLFSTYSNAEMVVYNHFNRRGDITDNTQSGENINATYCYDAFGSMEKKDGFYSSEYRFWTKSHDDFSGLDYFGYRYYSSEMGRWISKDPIELNSKNLYTFSKNNPMNFIDLYGLCAMQIDNNKNAYQNELKDSQYLLKDILEMEKRVGTDKTLEEFFFGAASNVHIKLKNGKIADLQYTIDIARSIRNNNYDFMGTTEAYFLTSAWEIGRRIGLAKSQGLSDQANREGWNAGFGFTNRNLKISDIIDPGYLSEINFK